ncbi:BRO-N domain-containing protein [Shewanella mangrovisoli]|uniref:BRO-N domain-containing protein n=1 Tax=Shewanella mangrovisoli TaxID=2864211 RepID=UPI003709C635
MSSNLMKICYEGDAGSSDIRTCEYEDILYISLRDVLITLNKENRELDEKHISKSMSGIIKNQLNSLEVDEYRMIPTLNPVHEEDKEIFVTQPGLYRVLSSDKSKAGKKFQKWLFHEVVPSLTKYGCYPPPATTKGSALSQMAEILAQNSRALADAIVRQDRLEEKVEEVESKLGNIDDRILSIESKGIDLKHIVTVRERLEALNIQCTNQKETDIVAWCENLNFSKSFPRIPCPSGDRLKARFSIQVIDEATNIVDSIDR